MFTVEKINYVGIQDTSARVVVLLYVKTVSLNIMIKLENILEFVRLICNINYLLKIAITSFYFIPSRNTDDK